MASAQTRGAYDHHHPLPSFAHCSLQMTKLTCAQHILITQLTMYMAKNYIVHVYIQHADYIAHVCALYTDYTAHTCTLTCSLPTTALLITRKMIISPISVLRKLRPEY